MKKELTALCSAITKANKGKTKSQLANVREDIKNLARIINAHPEVHTLLVEYANRLYKQAPIVEAGKLQALLEHKPQPKIGHKPSFRQATGNKYFGGKSLNQERAAAKKITDSEKADKGE